MTPTSPSGSCPSTRRSREKTRVREREREREREASSSSSRAITVNVVRGVCGSRDRVAFFSRRTRDPTKSWRKIPRNLGEKQKETLATKRSQDAAPRDQDARLPRRLSIQNSVGFREWVRLVSGRGYDGECSGEPYGTRARVGRTAHSPNRTLETYRSYEERTKRTSLPSVGG